MKKPEKLTEKRIQDLIYRRFNTGLYTIAIPSTQVMGWESDMVIVTRALVVHEFEIKISRSDFRADKKKEKFDHFRRWNAGETVIDPFLGSGTTLIAAEKLKRICYGMELDPKYVDVSVERWVKSTGINSIKRNGKAFIWK